MKQNARILWSCEWSHRYTHTGTATQRHTASYTGKQTAEWEFNSLWYVCIFNWTHPLTLHSINWPATHWCPSSKVRQIVRSRGISSWGLRWGIHDELLSFADRLWLHALAGQESMGKPWISTGLSRIVWMPWRVECPLQQSSVNTWVCNWFHRDVEGPRMPVILTCWVWASGCTVKGKHSQIWHK